MAIDICMIGTRGGGLPNIKGGSSASLLGFEIGILVPLRVIMTQIPTPLTVISYDVTKLEPSEWLPVRSTVAYYIIYFPLNVLIASDQLKERYGKGTMFTEKCPKCGTTESLFSSGVHESESGSLRVYCEDDIFVCPKCPPHQKETGIKKVTDKVLMNVYFH